ncbi:coproporphyrinogen III oxidase [Sporotomaculum syntrophicum]|uniref:Coproporphyrinogen III oxidase n=1 Tax=Sporotomaculum syntrophicum TaxID=182264 RepID=A0A9D3AWZ9_9FIRM|nr:TIGR01212 family radical SAM protein [Sporotomaculum syntrophicum]KAF1084477.1 coproporphyrinogen III oxidase [Sporotomaculum syntrophicum]
MQTSSRYNIYSRHLLNKFKQKVYKIPVNLPGTCPNRDGTLGYGGCIFCDESGSGFDALPNSLSVTEQLRSDKKYYRQRFNANKYIAYFQSFSNTYLPPEQFAANINSAAAEENIVGISVSTRPDCINEEYLDILSRAQAEKNIDINIELGLQTVNYHTLRKINRGHTLAEYIDAVQRIHRRQFEICTHIILNLPWDNTDDVIENSKLVSALGINYVKLHSLYIVRGTELGNMYERGEISLISLEQYIRRVITFLEYLDPAIVIQRLVGKGPQEEVLFCNWDISWWRIKHEIERLLEVEDTWQGKKFNYLNGKALSRVWSNNAN